MSKVIFLPCADGSDRNCNGKVAADNYSDSYYKLTADQQDQVEDMAEGYTRENGDFEEEIDGVYVEIEAAVCSACGSDYTRDDDGTIIDG